MLIKNSKKEKELERKRYIVSFILSGIIYIFIIILFILFVNFKTEDKKKVVITVRLQDKLDKELGNMSSKEQAKVKKGQNKAVESLKKKLEKSKKKLEKEIQKQEQSLTKEAETIKSSNPGNVEKKDIFEEYLKTKVEEKDKAKKEFFEENKNSDEDINDLNKLKDKLSMIDKALGDVDSKDADDKISKEDGDNNSKDDGINWEGGKNRDLLYKTDITVPDKFKEMGLKTSLKLKFTVFENGYIIKVEILESTGYPELDQNVISQFRNWRFKESIGESNVTGTIEIVINY